MPTDLPPYLQNQPWQAAQNFQTSLPGYFSNTGIGAAYRNQIGQNTSQGSAIAAAAANQYRQRAMQSGASPLGAGFAQSAAMVPVYQQNAALTADLAGKRMQMRGTQAQIGAGLAGDVSKSQGQYQSTLADYFLNKQRLEQQGAQFTQSNELAKQQLAQQGQTQNRQLSLQAAQLALQFNPIKGGFYATDNKGYAVGSTPYTQSVKFNGNILAGLGYPGLPFEGGPSTSIQGNLPAYQGPYL